MSYASHVRAAMGRPEFPTLTGTLTAATFLTTSHGYSPANAAGSMSPSTFPYIYEVTFWADSGGTASALAISGFPSDPGQTGAFTTATYNGVGRTAASATAYSYSSGVAQWSWSGLLFGMGSNLGVARAVSIV